MKLLIEICLICGFIECVFSATGSEAKALRQKLFVTDGYDNKIRPKINQSDPIEVYVNLYLLAINQLDEVTETLKTTGYLSISWHDDFLQWDPSLYGDINYYNWPQADVWKPDVALQNSYLGYKELGVDSLNVYVKSSGEVEWFPFQVFQSTCAVDITYFPYDVQECKMKFVAWSYSKAEVIIMSGAKGIGLEKYKTNSEWNVIDTNYAIEWETDEAWIVFTLKIKRKPMYVLLSVLMPIIMLALLNISVFLLPSDSGEKASYAVTIFLAFAVFLSLISSTLPENSDTIAIFSIYLIILTSESTMITLTALVLIRISSFDRDQSPVPGKLQSFLNLVTCRKCRNDNKVGEEHSERNGEINANVKFSTKKIKEIVVNDKFATKKRNEEDVNSNDESKSAYTWKDVSNTLDKVFFVFFALVLSISTLIFFVVTSTYEG